MLKVNWDERINSEHIYKMLFIYYCRRDFQRTCEIWAQKAWLQQHDWPTLDLHATQVDIWDAPWRSDDMWSLSANTHCQVEWSLEVSEEETFERLLRLGRWHRFQPTYNKCTFHKNSPHIQLITDSSSCRGSSLFNHKITKRTYSNKTYGSMPASETGVKHSSLADCGIQQTYNLALKRTPKCFRTNKL